MTASATSVPREVLLSFFIEATEALHSTRAHQHPVSSLAECRLLLLEEQRSCLEAVVNDHNRNNNNNAHDDDGDDTNTNKLLDIAAVQQALSQTDRALDERLQQSMESMNDAARLAFARLVLSSECQRTGTTSLNNINPNNYNIDEGEVAASRKEPLKTSRMTRSAMLEFCALGMAAIRLESVQAHIQDTQQQPLLLTKDLSNNPQNNNSNNHDTEGSLTTPPPPMKRLENLQRLLLQAIGYDADMGLKELARQVQMEGNDDVELVQVIQQTTLSMTETVLGGSSSGNGNTTSMDPRRRPELMSDCDQGGVTRVVSVQHSETMVQIVDTDEGGAAQVAVSEATAAPVSQSMREESDNDIGNGSDTASTTATITQPTTTTNDQQQQQQQQLQMARHAAVLRTSLVQELMAMSDTDRAALLQTAEQALQDFQTRTLQIPPGPDRIDFLRSMDATTQKLMAMHRIWQEHQASVSE